jgi:diguanylate cyclase (GGDEF)-like protein/PAS domain S-box-containing protein
MPWISSRLHSCCCTRDGHDTVFSHGGLWVAGFINAINRMDSRLKWDTVMPIGNEIPLYILFKHYTLRSSNELPWTEHPTVHKGRKPMKTPASLLVVDDSKMTRVSLQRHLQHEGYRVVTTESGRHALELVADQAFDVVLLDSMMPEMCGLAVVDSLRSRFSASELPIIMVTSNHESSHLVEAMSHGANDYITKPIDFPVLLARIETQVARKQAEDELRNLALTLEQKVLERTRELTQANNALRMSESRYRTLYEDNPIIFLTLSPHNEILSLNQSGSKQLGYEPTELVGQAASILCPESEWSAFKERLDACLSQPGILHHWTMRQSKKSGEDMMVRVSSRTVHDICEIPTLLLVCEDITEALHLSEKLSYQASHDPLTGLINRHEFERRLAHCLDVARARNTDNALCYVDLDQFKVINDTLGHTAGDELLCQVTRLLTEHVRKHDSVGRMGGDEFVLLIEHCTVEDAERVVNKVRRAIEELSYSWEGQTFRITASMGLVPVTNATGSITEALKCADTACYAAKDSGRNRVYVYRNGDEEMARHNGEMQWVSRIHRALDERKLHLYYQEIIPITSHNNDGLHYELLLRMENDVGELSPPGAFLPAAERYGLASKLDRWVITTAIEWLRLHPQHLDSLSLCSINLSGHSLGDDELLNFILQRFSETGIPPYKICFEITETAAITKLSRASLWIQKLRQRGCKFALDDFGSGLSSFGYLKTLPVDFLKIDGQFIKDINDNPMNLVIVQSIHEIARVMCTSTIAEFVESDAILEELRKIGIDFAQGYGISTPQPFAAMFDRHPARRQAIS